MPDSTWFKGNLHTHSNESDGDSSPRKVVEWYRDNGYDWLALTDHNVRTVLSPEDTPEKSPLVLTGEEVTVHMPNSDKVVVVQAIDISKVVDPINAGDVFSTVQANVDAIVAAGGLPCLMVLYDQPNFRPESIHEISGTRLLEIYNVKGNMEVYGDPSDPSHEKIWDLMLSSGKVVYGVAVDDAHHFNEFGPDNVNPGGAWVMLRAQELSKTNIISSLSLGDFYSSTGVMLETLDTLSNGISLEISPVSEESYRTVFVGKGGEELKQQSGTQPEYYFSGGEGYIRAVISSSNGAQAWIQPVFEI